MWRFASASVAGTAHVKADLPCQDAARAELISGPRGEEMLLAVAADGAGSAPRAEVGARLACDFFADEIRLFFAAGGEWDGLAENFIRGWVAQFQRRVAGQAQAEGLRPQDFACTLLAAVVGRGRAAYFHLGDGAIVESRRGETGQYRCAGWPQQGEYANTTNFLTDADAAEKIFVALTDHAVDEVALFTDGLQAMVLDFRARSAHAPFFAPLFGWLRAGNAGGPAELSGALGVYLNSEKVNARTDDDKTLILATRRAA
jgi:serine/threonine protein phosphatase PrpC